MEVPADTQSPELASPITQESSQETGLDTGSTQQEESGLVEGTSEESKGEESIAQEGDPSWTDDPRVESFWKGEDGKPDPNKMYSYTKSLESRQSEFDDSKNKLKELEGKLEESDTFRTQVQGLLDDPIQGPIMQKAFQDAEYAVAKTKYGELPDSELAYRSERDNQLEGLQTQYQELENKMLQKEQLDLADKAIEKIKATAKEVGIDPRIEDFVKHAIDNEVPVNSFLAEWNLLTMANQKEHWMKQGQILSQQGKEKSQVGSLAGLASNRISEDPKTYRSITDRASKLVDNLFSRQPS